MDKKVVVKNYYHKPYLYTTSKDISLDTSSADDYKSLGLLKLYEYDNLILFANSYCAPEFYLDGNEENSNYYIMYKLIEEDSNSNTYTNTNTNIPN
jgi:hypothetical protein